MTIYPASQRRLRARRTEPRDRLHAADTLAQKDRAELAQAMRQA